MSVLDDYGIEGPLYDSTSDEDFYEDTSYYDAEDDDERY